MSLYPEHVRGGWRAAFYVSPFAVGWLIYKYTALERFSWWDLVVQVGLAVFAAYTMAIFPDIDLRSRARRNILIIIFLLAAVLLLFHYPIDAFLLLALFFAIALFPKHRGITHSVVAAMIVPLIFLLLPVVYGDGLVDIGIPAYVVGVAAYFSHLILDRKTRKRRTRR